jgi:diguanylate cyclase (GGDEF)-like protein
MDSRTEMDQALDARTTVARTLQGGFNLLRFPDALEDRFNHDVAKQRMRLLRLSAAGGVIAAIGIVLPDYFMVPDVMGWALFLRLGLFVPFCLFCIWAAPRLKDPAYREWGLAIGGILGIASCLVLILLSDSSWAEPYLVILNVVVLYCVTVGRFWPSVAVSMVAALGHFQVLAAVHGHWGEVAIPSTLLLATSIGYTLYNNYRLEHRERLSYLLDLQERWLQADLAQANEDLSRTARTDALTEVANRRHLDEFLGQVWQEAITTGQPVGLMLLDIDHFKAYNDRYGHPAGDRCLVTVAQAVGHCLRKSGDLVARWGGEEFAVVMSATALDAAQMAADRVRQAVQECGIVHTGSSAASVVTVSVGVSAASPADAGSLAEFIREVDAALYRAKSQGRNRVVTHEGSAPARAVGAA